MGKHLFTHETFEHTWIMTAANISENAKKKANSNSVNAAGILGLA